MPAISNSLLLSFANSLTVLLLVKATVTVSLGLIAVRLASHRCAALRHALLRTTFIVLLCLPLVSTIAPPVPIVFYVPQVAVMPNNASQTRIATKISAPTAVPAAPSGREPSSRSMIAVPLLTAWLFGVAVSLLPLIVARYQIRSIRRAGTRWYPGQNVVNGMAYDVGISRMIEVLLHPAVAGPMTCGALHPVILFPPEAAVWSRENFERAVMHELEHIRRADWLTHSLARIVCAIYWFHPLVWFVERLLTLEAERACDDAVVGRSEPTEYAYQLLALARKLSAATKLPALAAANRADLRCRIRAILDHGRQRGPAGRASLILASTAAAALIVIMSPLRVSAQPTPQTTADLNFDAASIKPFPEGSNIMMSGCIGGPGSNDPVRINCEYVSLKLLLGLSYNVKPQEIVGPNWLDIRHFNIVAKVPQGVTKAEVPGMFRTLLADRFKIAVHHELRPLPTYVLSVSSKGLKLNASAELSEPTTDSTPPLNGKPPIGKDGFPVLGKAILTGGPIISFSQDHARLQASSATIAALAEALSRQLDRVVIDGTKLPGKYDITLYWTPDILRPERSDTVAEAGVQEFPNLFTALEQQLGLKVESKKVDRDTIIVDSATKMPVEN